MITFKEFILESFIDTVKDEETKNKIKELIQKNRPLDAYKLFKGSQHEHKKAKWSPVNPKTDPERWEKTAK